MKTKLFYFVLILSMLLNPMLVNAQEANNVSILTYEEAVNIAIRNNTDLQKNRLTQRQAEENSKLLNSMVDSIPAGGIALIPGEQKYNLALQATGLNIQKDQASVMEPFIVESLSISIKNSFNTIDRLNNEIDLYKKKIDLEQKNRRIISDKNRLGMASDVELNNQDKKIKDMQSTLNNKLLQLDKAYYDLKKAVGIQYNNNIKIEPVAFEYSLIDAKDDILEYRIAKTLEKDIQIWMLNNQIKLNDVEIAFSGMTSLPLTSLSMEGKPAEVNKLENAIVYTNIQDAKQGIRTQVINKRNSLKELEIYIQNNKQILSNLNKDKELLQLQYNQGMVTKLNLETLSLSIEELNTLIYEQEKQYEFLKQVYLNPYVAGSSF